MTEKQKIIDGASRGDITLFHQDGTLNMFLHVETDSATEFQEFAANLPTGIDQISYKAIWEMYGQPVENLEEHTKKLYMHTLSLSQAYGIGIDEEMMEHIINDFFLFLQFRYTKLGITNLPEIHKEFQEVETLNVATETD